MSSESHGYKQGLERGRAGKGDAQSLLDVEQLFDSASDRAARQRGFEAGAAARATAEAISAEVTSGSSTSSGSYDPGPIFLLRKWFPKLFPWSEDDALSLILQATTILFAGSGLLYGLYYGYNGAGIGAGIVMGLILGGIGLVAGMIIGFFRRSSCSDAA